MILREFVSSWEVRNEHRLTWWIDRNVPSCKGRRVEGSRLKLAWKAGFDRIQNDDNLTRNGGSGTRKEDWEDELPSGEKVKLEEAFNNMYHIVLDNPVFPCDPLTNRIWRKFRRWQNVGHYYQPNEEPLMRSSAQNLRAHPDWRTHHSDQ